MDVSTARVGTPVMVQPKKGPPQRGVIVGTTPSNIGPLLAVAMDSTSTVRSFHPTRVFEDVGSYETFMIGDGS